MPDDGKEAVVDDSRTGIDARAFPVADVAQDRASSSARGEVAGESPLVSVIVPVYKVEAYLRACLDSVLAQTYENLEVILVDDGSPDGCPAICDEYVARDARVRVIHKANGGLSDARNAGLDVARGDYIGFVDSDDLAEPRMFEALLAALLDARAQIAVCNHATFALEGVALGVRGVRKPRVLDRRAAMAMLVEDDEVQNYVWNKLFSARLWDGVRFPVGQKFEDVNTAYKLFDRAERVTLLPDALYWYRMRADGIVKSRELAGEIDCVDANMQRYEALRDAYPECKALMARGVVRAIINVWPLVWQERANLTPELRTRLAAFSSFAREHADETGITEMLGPTGRATLRTTRYATSWAWALASLFNRMYQTKHPQ